MNNTNSEWLDWGLHLTIGSTIVLTFGLLTIVALQRYSSATKHFAGTLTCISLLLLPLGLSLLPTWSLGLVQVTPKQPTQTQISVIDSAMDLAGAIPLHIDRDVTGELNSTATADVSSRDSMSPTAKQPQSLSHYVLAIYVLGVAFGLVRFLIDHLLAHRLTLRSEAFQDVQRMGGEFVSHDSIFHQAARIRTSNEVSVPMVTGIVRPTILLPVSVTNWSDEKLRSALAHEIAHIERHDLAVQALVAVVSVLYWPHPLQRLLNRIMRVDREIACDDKAFGSCENRPQYARHLLDFASQLRERDRDLAGVLAMARESNVERRISAVLSSTRRRSPPTTRSAALILAATVSCLLGSSLVSPFSASAVANAPIQENPSTVSAEEGDADGDSKPDIQITDDILHGRVLTPDGKPAHGATVKYPSIASGFPGVETTTDAEGTFEIKVRQLSFHPPVVVQLNDEELLGFANSFSIKPARERSVRHDLGNIHLKPAKRIRVMVLNSDRAPVANAAIYLQGGRRIVDRAVTNQLGHAEVIYPHGYPLQTIGCVKEKIGCDYLSFRGSGEKHPGELRQGYDGDIELHLNGTRTATVKVLGPDDKPLEGIRLDPWYITKAGRSGNWMHPSIDEFSRITDEGGVAVFDMLPFDQPKGIQIWPRLTRRDWFVIGTQVHRMSNGSAFVLWEHSDSVTVRVAEKVRVWGRVQHPNGQPAANIQVVASGGLSYGMLFERTALSDEEGRWEMLVKPSTWYLFVVQDEQYCALPHEGVFVPNEGRPEELQFQLEPVRRVFGKVAAPIVGRTSVVLQQKSTHFDKKTSDFSHGAEYDALRFRRPSASRQSSTMINADGTYEFKVGPGDFYIRATGQQSQNFRIVDEREKEIDF